MVFESHTCRIQGIHDSFSPKYHVSFALVEDNSERGQYGQSCMLLVGAIFYPNEGSLPR
jgi:hypothetical protein